MTTPPRIKTVVSMDGYQPSVLFDDGKKVVYKVAEDIETVGAFKDLCTIDGLWLQVQQDKSRTVIYWNDWMNLSSDTIYEYGRQTNEVSLTGRCPVSVMCTRIIAKPCRSTANWFCIAANDIAMLKTDLALSQNVLSALKIEFASQQNVHAIIRELLV